MPVITFEGGPLKKEQKTALVHELTRTAAEATGIPQKFFTVVLHEQPEENLGFGGETVEEIKARLKK
jgi:4-oxalocrotonate tautomerase